MELKNYRTNTLRLKNMPSKEECNKLIFFSNLTLRSSWIGSLSLEEIEKIENIEFNPSFPPFSF